MNRKLVSVTLTGTMMMSMLAGCGANAGQATSTSAAGSSSAAATEAASTSTAAESNGNAQVITLSGWYTEDNMSSIIEAANKQLNGEYVIEYTYYSLDDYNNILSTQLQAQEGPDIICDGANFPARIKAGNLVDITDQAFLADFNDAGFALAKDGDQIYGIPSYGWFDGVWYNADILDANGVAVPNNFDELLEACKTLSDKGVQPLEFGLSDGDTALHSLLGLIENDYWEKDGKDFDYQFAMGEANMDGTLNEYVEHWKKMIDDGYITPEMVGISNDQALADFIAGKCAFFNGGPWQYNNLKEAGMNFGIIANMGTSSEDHYLLGGPACCYGVNVNSANQEGAMKALAALASLEAQQAFVDANAGGSSYRKGVVVEVPDEYANIKDILEKGNIACCWDRWSVNMPSQTAYDEFREQLQGLVTGDITVDGLLQAMDSKAAEIRYQ